MFEVAMMTLSFLDLRLMDMRTRRERTVRARRALTPLMRIEIGFPTKLGGIKSHPFFKTT
jgi:hypothetical protein